MSARSSTEWPHVLALADLTAGDSDVDQEATIDWFVQTAATNARKCKPPPDEAAFTEHMDRTEDAARCMKLLPAACADAHRTGGLPKAQALVANTIRDTAINALSINAERPLSIQASNASLAFDNARQALIAMREPQALDALSAVLSDQPSCSICMELICCPVSLACGHSFCGGCFVGYYTHGGNGCPGCRAPFPSAPPAMNILLQNVAESLHASQNPSSDEYTSWEERKANWAAVQPQLPQLWTDTETEEPVAAGGGGSSRPEQPAEQVRRPIPPVRGDAIVAPDAGAEGRAARLARRTADRERREQEDERHRIDEAEAAAELAHAPPPPPVAAPAQPPVAAAPEPPVVPPPNAPAPAAPPDAAPVADAADAIDRREGLRRAKQAIADSAMDGGRTGSLESVPGLTRAVRDAALEAMAADAVVHVTGDPGDAVCQHEYGMNNRVLARHIARLDVAAITAARLAGHYVLPFFANHGRKFVLWCAPRTLNVYVFLYAFEV